jgi:phage baseplate assembly protein W
MLGNSTNSIQPVAISLPFSLNRFGNVSTTSDQKKIWADRVRSAVGTALTQRIMRPTYGTAIPQLMFDSVDVVSSALESEINSVFANYLPALIFEESVIEYDERQNVLSIDVRYRLPDGEEELVTLGVATLNGNQIIREDLT